MKSVGNLTKLQEDIKKGEALPVVDGSLKHYIPWYLDECKSDQAFCASESRKMDFNISTTSGVATPIMVSAHPETDSVPAGSAVTPIMVSAPSMA